MLFILLKDGTTVEIPNGFDVIHKTGTIDCLDPWGELLTSFLAADLLAYSLNPRVAQEFSADAEPPAEPPKVSRSETRGRVGQASAKMRLSSQDLW